jgi:hypothetical protein
LVVLIPAAEKQLPENGTDLGVRTQSRRTSSWIRPPLNVKGVDPEHVRAAALAAKCSYNSSNGPAQPPGTP